MRYVVFLLPLPTLCLVLVVSAARADSDSDARAAVCVSLALRQAQTPAVKGDCGCGQGAPCVCGADCDCAACAKHGTAYYWAPFADGDRTQCKLMRRTSGKEYQVGVWVYRTKTYYPILGGQHECSPIPSLPPISPPESKVIQVAPAPRIAVPIAPVTCSH